MSRKQQAFEIRKRAAEIARDRNHPNHCSNKDEEKFENLSMNFTKGLEHDPLTGLYKGNQQDYGAFTTAIDSPSLANFKLIPISPVASSQNWRSAKARGNDSPASFRAWESMGAGHLFDLEGADSQSVTMDPAPRLGEAKLQREMKDVYLQALMRDFPLKYFYDGDDCCLTSDQKELVSNIKTADPGFDPTRYFRGSFEGDEKGPYLSQFMLMGSANLGSEDSPKDGYIMYGAQRIDQRVRQAANEDYMMKWDEWLDVQEGASLGGEELYEGKNRRFMHTGRDLATYVHYDALYQAYLNACLLIWSYGATAGEDLLDTGLPFRMRDINDNQQGFAHFGGPHILSLVTEVATRALKAVRFQKFNTHRRLRPEALAARIQMHALINESNGKEQLEEIAADLKPVLDLVSAHNYAMTGEEFDAGYQRVNGKSSGIPHNYLLPMAFCEGSPMHPSYGAGHATVAGACVTILKAFFNTELYLELNESGDTFRFTRNAPKESYGFTTSADGNSLEAVKVSAPLTLEGELNKLAANISIGRNWAGVHYHSDYRESLIMGEEIAITILEEQSLTYNEMESPFENGPYMSLKTFEGKKIYIYGGKRHEGAPKRRTE